MMKTLEERALFHKAGTILHHQSSGPSCHTNGIYVVTDEVGGFELVAKRKGGWSQIKGGRAVYAQDLRPEDIRITDIAHAIGMQVRWNGWVSHFYSVGQHSVYVAIRAGQIARALGLPKLIIKACEYYGLMHDASEAYLGDIITPLKAYLPLYYEIEKAAQGIIMGKFDHYELSETIREIVHTADHDLLFIERNTLIWCGEQHDPYPSEDDDPHMNFTDLDEGHTCWDPVMAKGKFIASYLELANWGR